MCLLRSIVIASLSSFIIACSNGITYIKGHNIGYAICDNTRDLTTARENDAFRWSPNGDWLAYTRQTEREPSQKNSLYIRKIQSGSDRELVHHLYGDVGFSFDWSPDNNEIVFEHDVCVSCNANISKVNLTTGVIQLMTPLSTNDMQPSWASAGDRIAFVNRSSTSGADIFWMNSNGTGRWRLTNTMDNDTYPVWSPDSGRIAFVRGEVTAPYRKSIASIVRNELAGRVTVLVSGFSDVSYLSWSPDGAKLLFHGREMGVTKYAVYTVNADGSNLINLSAINNGIYREVEDMFPSWSRDGSLIAFSRSAYFMRDSVNVFGQGMLFEMKGDSSDKRRVSDEQFVHTIEWRPKDILCF